MGNRKMFHLAEIEVTFQPANGKLREDTIVWCVVWRIFGHYNNRQERVCALSPFPEDKKPTTMVGYKAVADPHHLYPNPHQNYANLRPPTASFRASTVSIYTILQLLILTLMQIQLFTLIRIWIRIRVLDQPSSLRPHWVQNIDQITNRLQS